MTNVMIACAILIISSGCVSRSIAPFQCPPRPELISLTDEQIESLPDTVLQRFDHNILETQAYVLKCEARERIANGET